MKPISLEQMLSWIPNSTLKASAHISIQHTTCLGVNTDSRSLKTKQLFVALKGERFDGHQFLNAAAQQGAAAVMVNFDATELNQADGAMPKICVPDTGKALQDLSQGYRQQFNIPLVLVTGSNGKTTAKEMIHSIFNAHCQSLGTGTAAHCTQGNFNNDIGLPLTLLRISDEHSYSTIELGMNHPGETAVLAAIAAPTVVLINNAQREHQEFMKTVLAVAVEHADSIDALSDDGVAVFPAQDTNAEIWRQAAKKSNKKTIEFSLHDSADATPAAITGTRIEQGLNQQLWVKTPQGDTSIQLNTAGEHNARNALAAIAVATAAGIPLASIVTGLQTFEPVKGRMQQHQANGMTVIDDSYNANPDSVAAAIRVLAQQGDKSILVLGDMGEVGDQGIVFHQEAGNEAASLGVGILYTLGQLSSHAHHAFVKSGKISQHFEDAPALIAHLQNSAIEPGSTVLVKGSRFMKMERMVDALVGSKNSAAGGH